MNSLANPREQQTSEPNEPVTAQPIVGACVYCGCSDPREPMVHCYEHDVIVRLWCADVVACDQRQEHEARTMSREACCESSEARRIRLEVEQAWAEYEAERAGEAAA